MGNKKICFISHNATRSGAPIVLYNLVKWIKEHTQQEAQVWFIEGGEMLKDFETVCKVVLLEKKPRNSVQGFLHRGIKKITGDDLQLKSKLSKLRTFDLVVFNTVASFKILHLIKKTKSVRFAAWLHEQSYSIERWYMSLFTHEALSVMDEFIVVSSYIKDYLIDSYKINESIITILPPFIDTAQLSTIKREIENQTAKEDGSFFVGACGMQLWLKGPDLFLAVAASVKNKYPGIPIKFIWVGAESEMTSGIKYEIVKKELQDTVEFVGAKKNVIEYFQYFDLFLLTSREDSFPLVVMEACLLGKPVICFEGIGDITKIVRLIPANVAPYGDTDAIAERVLKYYNDKAMINKDGNILKAEVGQYDTQRIAPAMYEKLTRLL